MKRIWLTALLTVSMAGVMAADAPAPARSESNQRPGMGRGGRRGGRFLERLKSQFPNEVAEIEKLQSSDPEAARTKMRELMGKAGFGPFGRGGMMNQRRNMEPSAETLAKLKEKDPAGFAEYEKLKASDPQKAVILLRELLQKHGIQDPAVTAVPENTLRDRSRRSVDRVKAELKRRYPERYEAIEKLWKTDPDKARREFRELFKESNIRIAPGAASLQYEYPDPNDLNNAPGGNRGGMRGGFNPWMRNNRWGR